MRSRRVRHHGLLSRIRCQSWHFNSRWSQERLSQHREVLLNYSERIERFLIFVGRRDLDVCSDGVMIGHVEMHDGIVFPPGFFVVVIFSVGGVQVKERRGEKPQQNCQTCLRRQISPHGGYC